MIAALIFVRCVGYVDPNSLISYQRTVHTIDFSEVENADLQEFTIPFSFTVEKTGAQSYIPFDLYVVTYDCVLHAAIMHGLAGWFDIHFLGTSETVVLTTAPECPGTHWYQCRLLLSEPLAVNKSQVISGHMHFRANDAFSYIIELVVGIEGTSISSRNLINLKDQVGVHAINLSDAYLTACCASTTPICTKLLLQRAPSHHAVRVEPVTLVCVTLTLTRHYHEKQLILRQKQPTFNTTFNTCHPLDLLVC